jgi:hypothetical protein
MKAVQCLAVGAMGMSMSLTVSAQDPPTLRLTRDLRIDAARHNLTAITPPGGLSVGRDGTIAFSQNQDGTIRYFDANGASLGTFGRRGQGPGEFQQVVRLTWIADTLVVSDQINRRLTSITPDRKLVRTIPWLSAVSMPSRSANDAPRFRVGFPRMRYADGSQLLSVTVAVGSPTPDWPGGEKPGVPIIRVDSTGAFQRLVAWSPRQPCDIPWDAGSGMGSGTMPVPFCAQVIEEVAPDGSRMLLAFPETGAAPSFRVVALGATGDTLFARSFRYQPVSISRSVRDSARATRARGSQSQREAAARLPIPESYPPVARVIAGRDETSWIELYVAGGGRLWHVVDATGAVIGKVAMPPDNQLMVVSRSALWAIETDADGLQHIVRYRVTR